MSFLDWFYFLLVWNAIGFIICIFINVEKDADGWELANPIRCYKRCERLNIFGAILLSMLYNMLCPARAICYWLEGICTLGRKKRKEK